MRMRLNLRDAKSWDQIVAMVAAAAREAKPGAWIVGGGWHQEKWDAKPVPNVSGFPLHDSLSKAAPDNPVLLAHASGHAVFVNSAAMKAAGITRDTPNPSGGDIMKDASGNPAGLMNEGAQALAWAAMERDFAKRTPAEREAVGQREIDLAAEESISKGITNFQDAGSPVEVIERLKQRAQAGTLPLRLWVMLREPNDQILRDLPKVRMIGFGDNHLTVRAIKKQIDGATKFIPLWVKVAVAIALGLGTMVGWKRIVVTIGEKIGKTHLTYAQGAAAELVAMVTIGAADMFGLPVSTTHVLSSGVAGTMAANHSGLQMRTLRNLLMAWVLTLPAAIMLSGALYWVIRKIF